MQIAFLLLLSAGLSSAQTLNLSHDLTTKGIASSNMTPNQPALDSRPLLQRPSPTTLDFQNSGLYFKMPGHGAILCESCTNVTLQNFTVDFIDLPFTQVTVTAVDSTNRQIGFTPTTGYVQPTTVTVGAAPASVSFAGMCPGLVRIVQVNFIVPMLQTGDYPVQISIGGVAANTAAMTISN